MTPKELSLLESGVALKSAFVSYFNSWASTPFCQEILKEISTKVLCAEFNEEILTISFESEEEDEIFITFEKPYEGDFENFPFKVPKSYKTVVQMHNTITFGDGVPEDIEFYGYNGQIPESEFMMEELEGDPERHQGFCDAGQNWIIWDHQRKNALGEPVIVICDHGLIVEDNDDFPEQDEIPFGVGGLFIRLMKEFILEDTEYGWG